MPMSAVTKERLRLARLAKVKGPKTELSTEPIVTHETDAEWIEVTVRIKRSSGASGEQ